MKHFVIICTVSIILSLIFGSQAVAHAGYHFATDENINADSKHEWAKMGTKFEVIPIDTHEFTVWHNFVKRKKTCEITHKIKTVVWYCNVHHHTRSETILEEMIHSENHE